MASPTSGTDTEGPVQTLISKKLRSLRKKLTRISQLEESQSTKPLNKEQSDLVKSRPQIVAIIEEYEKLWQPLQVAVQEELSQKDSIVEDLVKVLYFGSLFDVKSQNDFANVMLTRIHERGCCLTYDYVDDDDKELLEDGDLDLISKVGNLMISKDVSLKVSHKMAVDECIKRAKLWVEKAELPISPDTDVTYAGLREKLNKIISLDYFTMTPEMKAPVDVAAAAYNINATSFAETENIHTVDEVQINVAADLNQHKEQGQEEFQQIEANQDQSTPHHTSDENEDESIDQIPYEDNSNSKEKEQERVSSDTEHNQKDLEQKEQQGHEQYIPRRGYQNQRGGGRGGGRGYSNGRGGAYRGRGGNGTVHQNGRGGNGGVYQNGRGQQQYYNDSRYYYNNTRGRGGGRGSAVYNGNNHADQVELNASS